MKVFINAVLYPVTRPVIQDGVLIIDKGKIVSLGQKGEIEIPQDAEIIDVKGNHITPGFLDPHTHIGIWNEGVGIEGHDGNEMTDPITPYLRAIDGIYPEDMGFQDAVEGGVTTVGVTPGSANLIGGEFAALKTIPSETIEEKLIAAPVGMKFALGENPKRVYRERKKAPTTRMANAYLIRQTLRKAMHYAQLWDLYQKKIEKKEGVEEALDIKPPEPDLGMEALGRVLLGEVRARFHSHRADDIMTAIRIAKEFGLDFTIDHCTEGHKIADILAQEQIPCIFGPAMTSRSKVELRNRSPATAGVLVKKGVKVSITTDHPVIPIKYLRVNLLEAIRMGLPRQEALKTITINPAQVLGVENRVGSLEPQKDADLVIFNGDPLDFESEIIATMIDGKVIYGEI